MGTYVQTVTEGNVTTTTEYTCEEKGMQYTVISEDIKKDFDFLLSNGEIAEKLDEMLKELSSASSIVDAFSFESGTVEKDISKTYDEIKTDVESLKSSLQILHDAFITDIDNVNAELETNFGHFVGYSVSEGNKTTTTTNNS